MSDLIFYTHPQSRGRTVRWMLEECDVQYETTYLTYQGTMKEAGYLNINPMGKVPAIVHNGHIVTEQSAVVAYLADAFPNANLVPQNRAEYYRWLFFLAGPLEAALMDKALHVETAPEMQIALGYGSLELAIKTLEGWLKGRSYIAGDHFTAADVYAVSALSYGKKQGMIQSDIFNAYCAPHYLRPAFMKASQIDDAK